MTFVLIEVCFVKATEDVAIYNKLGADRIGRLIAQAIANQTTSATTNSNSSSSQNSGGEYLINSGIILTVAYMSKNDKEKKK
ncbi:hypothetical protein [uncultured Clostridium sp.]|uniref:hypothetical protein n=1 Tax=uncultured Clostridium sp. TaxID=59620 RepID=UPI002671E542|nr:hypothetical protein [uncultured Clostridium sp.]